MLLQEVLSAPLLSVAPVTTSVLGSGFENPTIGHITLAESRGGKSIKIRIRGSTLSLLNENLWFLDLRNRVLLITVYVHTHTYTHTHTHTDIHLIYLFLALWGLRCCSGFSLVAAIGGFSLAAVQRLIIAVASLLWSMGSRRESFSNCGVLA